MCVVLDFWKRNECGAGGTSSYDSAKCMESIVPAGGRDMVDAIFGCILA